MHFSEIFRVCYLEHQIRKKTVNVSERTKYISVSVRVPGRQFHWKFWANKQLKMVSLIQDISELWIFFNVYLSLRERETELKQKGAERETHRIWSKLQALSCQHRAWRGAQIHVPQYHARAEAGRLTHWATQVPQGHPRALDVHHDSLRVW